MRILGGLSLLLHLTVLLDYAWSPSGTPVFWRYSTSRLLLIGIYALFLAFHIPFIYYLSERASASRLLFGILFLSVLYAGIEALIRVHGFGMITPAKRYRAEYWFQGHPNRSWRHIGGRLYTTKLYETEIHNNSAGYHDHEHTCEEDPGVYRILLIGDSFVEAFQVPLESTVQTHLRDRLQESGIDAEVIAVGESGKGLNWQMSILPGLLDCYAPQLVISDYIAPLYVFRDGATRPKSSGGSVSAGPPSIQWESLLRTHPVTDALIWKNLSNSAGFVLVSLARILDARPAPTPSSPAPTASVSMLSAVDRAADQYASLQRELGEKGARLLVALYPISSTVSERRSPGSHPVSGRLEDRMEARLAANVPYVDLTRSFSVADHDVTTLFIPGDGHLTETGHRLVAESLVSAIRQEFPRNDPP